MKNSCTGQTLSRALRASGAAHQRGPVLTHISRALLSTFEVPVPSLGDSITDGTLVEWHKNAGEAVAVDDIVAVIETDKVSVDIRSPVAGVIQDFGAGVDDTVMVGPVSYTHLTLPTTPYV